MKQLFNKKIALIVVLAFMTCFTTACFLDDEETTSSVRLVNSSDRSIYYFYISPSNQNTWGADQLGSNTVPIGSSYTITGIPAPKNYDFKVKSYAGDCGYLMGHYLESDTTLTLTVYSSGWGSCTYGMTSAIQAISDPDAGAPSGDWSSYFTEQDDVPETE